MKVLQQQRSVRLGKIVLILIALSSAAFFHSDRTASAEMLTDKTWDGGGSTNNWSEAANWSGDAVPGAGDNVTFDATSTKNATIDVGINVGSILIASAYSGTISQSASINVSGCSGRFCFTQSGGTFNGSGSSITLNSGGFGALRVNGGTFNGGSGDINLLGAPADNAELSLLGGTFKSTSGTLSVSGIFRFQGVGTVFLHNNGTVNFTSGQNNALTNDADHPSMTFNNVNFNLANGVNFLIGPRVIVLGTLSLNDGFLGQNGSTIEARGGVSIAPAFDGGDANLELANGAGPRTFTLPTGIALPRLVVNDPNVTINTSGSGTLFFPHQLNLQQGTINQGNVDLLIGPRPGGGECYLQSGGTFNASGNTITFNSNGFGAITMAGGTFNGSSGDITLVGTPADNPFLSLLGGTFKSTSGVLTVPGLLRFQNMGTVFLHNNGTVNFTASQNTFITNDSEHLSMTFNNVNINLANGVNLGLGPAMIVDGNLNLNEGSVGQAGTTVEAQSAVVIGPNFDGGPTNFVFGGASNQTFANNGGVNPTGTWTVNKPFGIVTVATNLILQPTQAVNIASGGLYLGNGSSFSSGALTIGTNGRFLADSAQTITLGGDISNSGLINLHANGTACPTADSILLRSSAIGTQRNWSGPGVFRAINVDVRDMGGSAAIKVFNSTNSGNNNSNWTFDNSCLANFIHTLFDFDGDRKTDVSVFRPATAVWFIDRSTLGIAGAQWGLATDKLTPADFDGDGITDVAVWREATRSHFFILQSSSDTVRIEDFGITGDVPVTVGDWDGDGKADAAVYRNAAAGGQSFFFFRGSFNNPNGNVTFIPWGAGGDKPVRGDFDGDGKADPAVFKSDGSWWIRQSSNGALSVQYWGLQSDKIVDGDFDGDGKTDLAVFRPSETNWYILQSSNGQARIQPFGFATDLLTPGDYDGDGKTDLAIWRPSNGQNWALFSTTGNSSTITFGTMGDVPVAAAYTQ